MNVNMSSLRTFLEIVATGSLVAASERLNITQSAVTARLKNLEAQLGQTLLRRGKAGVQLTSSGVKFKRYAEVMLDLWRQAQQETSLPAGVAAVCNLGCHLDLWPTLGRRLYGEIRRDHRDTAFYASPGSDADLEKWLGTGLVDAALSYRPSAREKQTVRALKSERLVLVSTRADTPSRADPSYVYVDAGEDFGRHHVAAYSDAGVARVGFGCAQWALDHLLDHGGSAYLPERLAEPYCADGRLHRLPDAPAFTRTAHLVTNDAAAADWPWLAEMAGRLAG